MSCERRSFLLLAGITTFIFQTVNCESFVKRAASPVSLGDDVILLAQPAGSSSTAPALSVTPVDILSPATTTTPVDTWWTPAAPAPSLPTTHLSNPVPIVTPPANLPATTAAPAGCTSYQCNIFYQYVSVYYWEDMNSACQPGASKPTATAGPGNVKLESPSIYVFFPSISANDGCTQVGNTYSSTMTSFAPGQLSTIAAPGVTKVFDFENLACGAKPLIAPPSFLFNLDPAFHDCIPGLSQGVDPPTAVPAGGADSTPVGRFKRAQAHARAEGWAPRQTPAPT
ncbi:hypothetical protein MMC28_010022 [Mycoblastus sanguinarius]|nr:hypothetical protein [Mycoblastus sanguinarius]